MVNTIASLVAWHGPAGSFVVSVSVMLPAVLSAADGVYMGVNKFKLSNVPVPEVLHVDDVALPPRLPDKV